MTNKSWLTAIKRPGLSKPMQFLTSKELIKWPALDYGCGLGVDAFRLNMDMWDPWYFNTDYFKHMLMTMKFQTITCNYVLNVLPDPAERNAVVNSIYNLLLPSGTAYISVRRDQRSLKGWTSKGTWQGYVQLDLPILTSNSGFAIYQLDK